ncbi:hypothetical protein T11_15570, partial [Trichinella zimbabwensis]
MGKVPTLQAIHYTNFATLSNLSICNPSWKETIKNHNHQNISKNAFHTKRENSKGYRHEISKFLKILLFFRNDVNWSDKIRNHEWTWSHVARLRISRDIAGLYDFKG